MPRQKKCRHRADGEECLLTFPFIGRRPSKTTRSRVHVQTVGLNAETKKVSAPSRRRRMPLDIPFYRTSPEQDHSIASACSNGWAECRDKKSVGTEPTEK